MGGSEELYLSCLRLLLEDPSMTQLHEAIAAQRWDDAFTAAHALKGLAGNMGFVPLMHSIGQLVILIRGGRVKDIPDALAQAESSYRDITDAISLNFIEDNTRGASK